MKFLFIITKGMERAGSAIRAMQIASMTSEQGNHVEVFLIDEAVHWAQGIKGAYGEGLSDFLDMLKSRDHPVLVCKSCAEKRLIKPEDLIEGTVIAPMPLLVEKLANPDYKVLTF
jgi:sulfur relay (sulfurtransferase) complex TusBCD TusD component (DsrE family)